MPEKLSSPPRTSVFDDFLAISRILTGVENLDADLGRQYLDRLNSSPFNPLLSQILKRFQELKGKPDVVGQVKKQIVADDSLRPTVCQIILLWYTSTVQDNLGMQPPAAPVMRFGTQEEYFSGLAWTIIGAHPPGLSGGYFGHWRYRPDNEPKESK
jgi:hypothetical protein